MKIIISVLLFLILKEQNFEFCFLYFNFSIKGDIINPKEIIIENLNINNKMIRCRIVSHLSFIKCFYNEKINNDNYFASFDF